MHRSYKEKLLEEFVRDFPIVFLGENLILHKQQPLIGGFRPDLVFLDAKNNYVIVEVQLNALDRNHIYRILEYRDLLVNEVGCSVPRTLLFCNEINENHKKLLEIHKIEWIAWSRKEFIEKAKALCPDLLIKEEEIVNFLTISSIFNELGTLCHNHRSDPEALVIWLPGWFPHRWEREPYFSIERTPLPLLPESVQLFFNNYHSYSDITAANQIGTLNINWLPKELIIDLNGFTSLTIESFDIFEDWLEVLTHYSYSGNDKIEIVLGYRNIWNDIYEYEDHIRNRIKKFQPLWRRYGEEKGYNLQKIKEDIQAFKKIKFYAGKYPNLVITEIFHTIEIESGPGPLLKGIDRRRDFIKRGFANSSKNTDQLLKELDEFIEKDFDEWVTITFNKPTKGLLEALLELSKMLKIAACGMKSRDLLKVASKIGLLPAKRLSEISTHALNLSSRYFFHLQPPSYLNNSNQEL